MNKSTSAFGRLWKNLTPTRPAGCPIPAGLAAGPAGLAAGYTGAAVDERPQSAFELVTRRALDDLTRQVERLEAKVNAMMLGVAVAVLAEIYRAVVK